EDAPGSGPADHLEHRVARLAGPAADVLEHQHPGAQQPAEPAAAQGHRRTGGTSVAQHERAEAGGGECHEATMAPPPGSAEGPSGGARPEHRPSRRHVRAPTSATPETASASTSSAAAGQKVRTSYGVDELFCRTGTTPTRTTASAGNTACGARRSA